MPLPGRYSHVPPTLSACFLNTGCRSCGLYPSWPASDALCIGCLGHCHSWPKSKALNIPEHCTTPMTTQITCPISALGGRMKGCSFLKGVHVRNKSQYLLRMEKADFQTGIWNDRICHSFLTSETTWKESKNCHIRGKLCIYRSFKICIFSHTGVRGLAGSSRNCFLVHSSSTAADGFGKSCWTVSISISNILCQLHGQHQSALKTPTSSCTENTRLCCATLSHVSWHHLFFLLQFLPPCSAISFSVNELHSFWELLGFGHIPTACVFNLVKIFHIPGTHIAVDRSSWLWRDQHQSE